MRENVQKQLGKIVDSDGACQLRKDDIMRNIMDSLRTLTYRRFPRRRSSTGLKRRKVQWNAEKRRAPTS